MKRDLTPTVARRDASETLELLRAAMRQRGDFPAIAAVVRHLIGAVRDDEADEATIVRAVLSDATLTQKVLRLANSAMYAVFGDKVTTVSRAVQLLGTEAIVHVATGMRIMEGLSLANPGSTAAHFELTRASLAGAMAREIATAVRARYAEAAVVASLLRCLGRLLVAYYLPEDWGRVREQEDAGLPEAAAAETVLGLDYAAIGKVIGEAWGLPKPLVDGIAAQPKLLEGHTLGPDDWLAAISAFAAQAAAMQIGPEAHPPEALAALAGTFAAAIGADAGDLAGRALGVAASYSPERAAQSGPSVHGAEVDPTALPDPASTADAAPVAAEPEHWMDLVDQALADMHEMRKARAGLAALSNVVLECAHRALRLDHALMLVRHAASRRYVARVALGPMAEDVTGRLALDEAFAPDVFHVALMHDKCINISDVHAERIRPRIPAWFVERFPAVQSFFLIPLVVRARPVGLLFGAWETGDHHRQFTQNELNVLSRLREPWQQAFEQLHQPPAEPAPRKATA